MDCLLLFSSMVALFLGVVDSIFDNLFVFILFILRLYLLVVICCLEVLDAVSLVFVCLIVDIFIPIDSLYILLYILL